MSRLVKIHEYAIAWLLFVVCSLMVGLSLVTILGSISHTMKGRGMLALASYIESGYCIAWVMATFFIFIYVVRTVIVRSVEQRMRTAQSTETPETPKRVRVIWIIAVVAFIFFAWDSISRLILKSKQRAIAVQSTEKTETPQKEVNADL